MSRSFILLVLPYVQNAMQTVVTKCWSDEVISEIENTTSCFRGCMCTR